MSTSLTAISLTAPLLLGLGIAGGKKCTGKETPPAPELGDLSCLDTSFDGPKGDLKMIRIPTNGPGRMTIGDVDNDGAVDYVVSRRLWVTAYNVCGEELWGKRNRANWDNIVEDNTPGHDIGHPYWNWSSYGWVGDVNGDGANEFMNISDDWRTLTIHNGTTGTLEVTVDLGSGKWQYASVARMADGSPRVIVTHKPGRLKVKAFDLRNGLKEDWSVDYNYRLTHYIPPQIADINADGTDDILHGSAAIDGRNGELLWRHDLGRFGIGGAHTASARQIDPHTPGLESVYTVYSPKSKSSPSLVIIDSNGNMKKVFNGGRHAHQHAIGEFAPDVAGLETIGRDYNGKDHWMIDKSGSVMRRNFRLNPQSLNRRWGHDWGDNAGELIQGIDWDGKGSEELLYIERHVNRKNIPMLALQSLDENRFLYRAFNGGIDVARTDPNSIEWYGRTKGGYDEDGPYEGAALVADVFGDGREEIIAMAHNQIVIYYNSGDAGVPGKWGNHSYKVRKKRWVQVYNPR